MNFAATSSTVWQKLHNVPTDFWIRMAIGIAIIVAVVLVLRKLAQVNKVVLTVVAGLFLSVVGFSWIYERNEPTWATPAVSFLSGFFPTKGKIEHR
jgi:uncharacterized membrane protein HdeD (DUF308 family)